MPVWLCVRAVCECCAQVCVGFESDLLHQLQQENQELTQLMLKQSLQPTKQLDQLRDQLQQTEAAAEQQAEAAAEQHLAAAEEWASQLQQIQDEADNQRAAALEHKQAADKALEELTQATGAFLLC